MGGYYLGRTRNGAVRCRLLRRILLNEVPLAPVAGSFFFFTRLASRSRLSVTKGGECPRKRRCPGSGLTVLADDD
jgi:hypothetical protein